LFFLFFLIVCWFPIKWSILRHNRSVPKIKAHSGTKRSRWHEISWNLESSASKCDRKCRLVTWHRLQRPSPKFFSIKWTGRTPLKKKQVDVGWTMLDNFIQLGSLHVPSIPSHFKAVLPVLPVLPPEIRHPAGYKVTWLYLITSFRAAPPS
jgi:hypothetical protein